MKQAASLKKCPHSSDSLWDLAWIHKLDSYRRSIKGLKTFSMLFISEELKTFRISNNSIKGSSKQNVFV